MNRLSTIKKNRNSSFTGLMYMWRQSFTTRYSIFVIRFLLYIIVIIIIIIKTKHLVINGSRTKAKKNIMAKAFLWHILKSKSFYDTIHLKIQKHSYVEANKLFKKKINCLKSLLSFSLDKWYLSFWYSWHWEKFALVSKD